jgi:hypothetical protein
MLNIYSMFNQFFPPNRAISEIMWKKCGSARQAMDNYIIRRIHFACRTTKATNTHLEYAILLFRGNNGYANVP